MEKQIAERLFDMTRPVMSEHLDAYVLVGLRAMDHQKVVFAYMGKEGNARELITPMYDTAISWGDATEEVANEELE